MEGDRVEMKYDGGLSVWLSTVEWYRVTLDLVSTDQWWWVSCWDVRLICVYGVMDPRSDVLYKISVLNVTLKT